MGARYPLGKKSKRRGGGRNDDDPNPVGGPISLGWLIGPPGGAYQECRSQGGGCPPMGPKPHTEVTGAGCPCTPHRNGLGSRGGEYPPMGPKPHTEVTGAACPKTPHRTVLPGRLVYGSIGLLSIMSRRDSRRTFCVTTVKKKPKGKMRCLQEARRPPKLRDSRRGCLWYCIRVTRPLGGGPDVPKGGPGNGRRPQPLQGLGHPWPQAERGVGW